MRAVNTNILLVLVVSTLGLAHSFGQNPEIVELKLYPKPVPRLANSVRLLPTDFELKSGNAAVVLLRMPWEEVNFMNKVLPKASELANLEYDDPRIATEFSKFFGKFRNQMRRAAYVRDADWNYPLGEEPMMGILLPDVQGMRMFAGHGMSLWIGTQIAQGNLDEAREGILIQLAIARHVSRTPFGVCKLVGNVIADAGLQRLEVLLQQPDADNFYHALSLLPDTLGSSVQEIFEYESLALPNTLPSLTDPFPPIGDPAWKEIAREYAEFIISFGVEMNEQERAELKSRILKVAKEDLTKLYGFTNEQVATMTFEEKAMRLVLETKRQFHNDAMVAVSRPLPAAILAIQELQPKIDNFKKRLDVPVEVSNSSFNLIGSKALVAMNRFGRRVKMLQVIEAIRDHASRNGNELPKSLMDIGLHIPVDPATGKPFRYQLEGKTATLSAEAIPEMSGGRNGMRTYQITIQK